MKNYNIYRDELHGIEACGRNESTAWGLIRNECHRMRLTIPTYNQIQFVRELTDDEMVIIRKRMNKKAR